MRNLKQEIDEFVQRNARWSRLRPRRASEAELRSFETRFGITLPAELREWLETYNGVEIDPGGLYGINTGSDYHDIEATLELVPEWLPGKWVPLAGDGCGNYWVMDCSEPGAPHHFISFIDEIDYSKLDYVVASGIWTFLDGMLRDEFQEIDWWPFDRERVLQHDPALATYRGPVPFPWEADSGVPDLELRSREIDPSK
jgi:cell wall assembly regulator SMI1